jgi:hypothetical protein
MSESTLTRELLSKYVDDMPTFIETGTAAGNGTQTALDYGFQRIMTIEANVDTYVAACQRFSADDRVILAQGDGQLVLPGLLRGVHEPAVFWLDSHWSTGEAPLPEGTSPCPVLGELRAIADHSIKDHIIMIDDIRYFKHGIEQWLNITLGDIVDGIMAINPDYWITFEKGITDNDILIAVAQ